ncbi:hypothetical protein BP6252_11043 [Coleophoma cylindrospora]|uniref:Uncharacterized protein n=1 Tax=Coleophoma cylindrospora TaxID=1849047 RepID=A0A3D8QP88_9HELO|nr:hypothetical protein BP6252_11043 [Coleophoma cylindrospora]
MRVLLRLAAVVIGATLVNAQNSTTGNTTDCANYDMDISNSNIDAVLSCIKNNPDPPIPYYLYILRSYQGALAVPSIVTASQIDYEDSAGLLNLTSLDLPDLEQIVATGFFIYGAAKLSELNAPKLRTIRGSLTLNLVGGPAINLSFPSLEVVESGIYLNGTIDRYELRFLQTDTAKRFSIELPALNSTSAVQIFSTGKLDCNAFAASVVNATPAYNAEDGIGSNTSVICNSKKGNVTTFRPSIVASSRGSKMVSNLLLWSVVVGCLSLVA